MTEVKSIDGCGCMYDAGGRLFRSRCICPPELTPEQTLRAVAGLGGGIGDAVAGMLAARDAARARVAELEAENERLRAVADVGWDVRHGRASYGDFYRALDLLAAATPSARG